MTFVFMLMPANVSAPPPSYELVIERIVRANGAQLGPHGDVRLADGGQFVFKKGDFYTGRLTRDVCRIAFYVALQTNTYITNGGGGSDLIPLKVKGSTLKIPPDLGPPTVVANPAALCDELQTRLAHWNEEMARLKREKVIDDNDQPLEPPPDPGAEPRLSSDPSGMSVKCEAYTKREATELGWKFVHSTITQNTRWGIVWRADIAPSADPDTWFRDSCWHVPGKIGFSMSSRPLEMFDKTQDIKPLPAK
jgi:hypothetical protein